MSQIGYLFRRIRGMNTRRMLAKAADIRVKTGKPRILILLDMVWCGIRYQAGYMDYALFKMYNMNAKQRASVLTRGKNNRYVAALNSKAGWPYFESKVIFLKTFSGYVGRKWVDLTSCRYEEFKAFAEELGRFIAKPPDGTHGDGVEMITLKDAVSSDNAAPAADSGETSPESASEQNSESYSYSVTIMESDTNTDSDSASESDTNTETDPIRTIYDRLIQNRQTLCEEVIEQHEGLSSIYAGSVNTIRTVTILSRGEAHVVAACLRIGNEGRVVDNFNNGGMVVPVDPDTGRISVPAADKAGRVYDVHPVSGASIVGAQIPLWDECLALVKAAAQVLPMVRYVGWDIAVTPNGPVLVEGNQFPGHDIYCLPAQTPSGMGILPAFEAVVPLRSLKHL